jgi:arylformamidase
VKIVDLTLPIANEMPAFPGEPTARFTPFSTIADDDVEMWNVSLFSQIGTHIDAPRHFVAGGRAIDEVELARCIGPATVVRAPRDADAAIDADAFAARAESLRRTKRLLLDTGWAARVGRPEYFTAYPSLTLAAAELLVELDVVFLGLDTPSPHISEFRALHEALFVNEMVIAECLVNVSALTRDEVFLAALPLRLAGLDGSPARIVAW